MSCKTHKTSNDFEDLKVAHENLLGVATKYHIGRYGGHGWHEYFGLKAGCTRSNSSQYRSLASKVR